MKKEDFLVSFVVMNYNGGFIILNIYFLFFFEKYFFKNLCYYFLRVKRLI